MSNLRIQIISDIHLEMRSKEIQQLQIEPKAPYLALLGDIGLPHNSNINRESYWIPEMEHDESDQKLESLNVKPDQYSEQYWIFLKGLCSKFKHIFVITGNHEYYGSSIEYVDDLLRKMSQCLPNVTFLNKDRFTIENGDDKYYVVGSCLWSNVPEEAKECVSFSLNDYRHISIFDGTENKRKITVDDTNNIHKDHLNWIQEQIEFVKSEQNRSTKGKRKLIVFTHHAPIHGASDPKYENEPSTSAFCTDLSSIMDGKYISAWGFGHTHYSIEKVVNGTLIISNQKGYPFEGDGETHFRNNLVICFPDSDSPKIQPWIESDSNDTCTIN